MIILLLDYIPTMYLHTVQHIAGQGTHCLVPRRPGRAGGPGRHEHYPQVRPSGFFLCRQINEYEMFEG